MPEVRAHAPNPFPVSLIDGVRSQRDKTWIYCYMPERKQQCSKWVFEGDRKLTKLRQARSIGKKRLHFFSPRQILFARSHLKNKRLSGIPPSSYDVILASEKLKLVTNFRFLVAKQQTHKGPVTSARHVATSPCTVAALGVGDVGDRRRPRA
ncbi:hypothetical protein EVAR_96899_1 [Eumeta japonica]|uniref:Uncharacterized protein n=1 Tax=Eumeta variegata TaxID=151549 RepID=A0A4C1WBZ6_EUMVA|nr:hypothetical protein EVAR_96899_1 [Eumeta japonica]